MRAVTGCLAGLAGLAAATGRHEEAARLFGSVETLRETVGAPGTRYEEERQSQDMAAVRDALGIDAELKARFAGQVLPLEEAVREALVLVDGIVGDAAPSSLLHSGGETS